MTDTADEGIVLIRAEGSCWLIEGERHMNAMLTNLEYFPRPVRCINFESRFEMQAFLPDDASLDQLWAINPEIVARLQRDGDLQEMTVVGPE